MTLDPPDDADAAGTAGPALPVPALEYVATLRIEVGEPVVVGETVDGVRRVIPIRGGRVSGPLGTGRVLPGGADYQLIRTATLTELEAKYAIEFDDGERLYVDNRGLRAASPEDTAAIALGEAVPPERVRFRSALRLHGPGSRGARLQEHVLVGAGRRLPDAVVLDVHALA